jgi:hypothetical protein
MNGILSRISYASRNSKWSNMRRTPPEMPRVNDNELLTRLVTLQEEQNQLLRKNLTRIKFSLWSLLLLMTALCVVLSIFMYRQQSTGVPTGAALTTGTLSIQGTTTITVPDTNTDGTLLFNVQPPPPALK